MIASQQDFFITLHGLQEALNTLAELTRNSETAMKRANFRIATLNRDAIRLQYAPRSPTMGDLSKLLKRKKKATRSGSNRPAPGGLEKSIEFEATAEEAIIYVADNSPAGKYAFKIHELKGSAWFKRGPGTISKGPKADDQFITRGIRDNAENSFLILKDMQEKAMKQTKGA